MRLPRFALLRCRYEGLCPSGQSVKGVRNDKTTFTTITSFCHSEIVRYHLTPFCHSEIVRYHPTPLCHSEERRHALTWESPLITQSGLIIFYGFGYFNIVKIIVS